MSEDQDLAKQAAGMELGRNEQQVAAFHDQIKATTAEAVANERAANEARNQSVREELARERIRFESTQQAKEEAY